MADNEVFRLLGGLRPYLFHPHVRIVPILGVLASPNHPSGGYVGAMVPGLLFRVLFWGPLLEGLGSIFGPKMGSEIRPFLDPFLDICWVQFLWNLGAILEPKKAQKGPRQLPKAVQNSYDSEKK